MRGKNDPNPRGTPYRTDQSNDYRMNKYANSTANNICYVNLITVDTAIIPGFVILTLLLHYSLFIHSHYINVYRTSLSIVATFILHRICIKTESIPSTFKCEKFRAGVRRQHATSVFGLSLPKKYANTEAN
jgi:hypothetical protein